MFRKFLEPKGYPRFFSTHPTQYWLHAYLNDSTNFRKVLRVINLRNKADFWGFIEHLVSPGHEPFEVYTFKKDGQKELVLKFDGYGVAPTSDEKLLQEFREALIDHLDQSIHAYPGSPGFKRKKDLVTPCIDALRPGGCVPPEVSEEEGLDNA